MTLAIAWANLIGAFVATVLNVQAARHGAIRARWLHAMTAVVGVAYVFGYSWLLCTLDDPRRWSETMRGVAVVAWVIVWWTPAILSLRLHRRDAEALAEAEELIRSLRAEP